VSIDELDSFESRITGPLWLSGSEFDGIRDTSLALRNVNANRNRLIDQRFCVGIVSSARKFASFVKSDLLLSGLKDETERRNSR
jgi:hypothetical protein